MHTGFGPRGGPNPILQHIEYIQRLNLMPGQSQIEELYWIYRGIFPVGLSQDLGKPQKKVENLG